MLYDLRDAPIGFREGAVPPKEMLPEKVGESEKVEPTIPIEGYVGGSDYYRRADGDKEAVGTGKMPGRLMN